MLLKKEIQQSKRTKDALFITTGLLSISFGKYSVELKAC